MRVKYSGYGRLVEEVTTFTTRAWQLQGNSKVIKRRRDNVCDHALKAYTRKQKIIARSIAEAELYAAALGASESKGIVSLLRDLGYETKPKLAIDAKATETSSTEQGIGKLKHIDVSKMWMQPRVCEYVES